MTRRPAVRCLAVLGATTLLGLTMAPAFASTVAQAHANALAIQVAGQANDTGTVTARHDGATETKDGAATAPVSLLQGQQVLAAGTLAQDATASVDANGDGQTAACAGIAGDGASVAEVGESRCLQGGDNVEVNLANLDLSGMSTANPATALAPLQAQLLDPLEAQVLEPLTAALSKALSENLGPLADVAIGGTIGTVEARCVATTGAASGTTYITDPKLGVTLAGQTVQVIDLPVEPAPNTKVVTNLDGVLTAVLAGLRTDLTTTMQGHLAGLTAVTDAVQQQVVNTLVDQVSTQLAPLEQNLLDVTLNKQVFPAAGQIQVTGIEANVVPAAAEQLGAPLVTARVANVDCGPNGRVAPAVEQVSTPKLEKSTKELPEVPRVIASGAKSAEADDSALDPVTLALLFAGLVGLVGLHRLASRS